MSEEAAIARYVYEVLFRRAELIPFSSLAAVVRTTSDPGLVWDFMFFLDDEMFSRFSESYGENFVLDDHAHEPWVFTRVKSLSWLRHDFQRRLPIALWIYEHATVIQDPRNKIPELVSESKARFDEQVGSLVRNKYIELRSERHNLRQAVLNHGPTSIFIVKGTVAKLALELAFLVEGKPYPYKKWLPRTAQTETAAGAELVNLTDLFLLETDAVQTINLSELIISLINSIIREKELLSDGLLASWWLYLD